MTGNNFKIQIKMLSDFHIGTGTGIPGGTDKLISKDVHGFPQIPAKTVVGIWRDATERLCEGLGGNWLKWVEIIFGIQPNLIKADELKDRLTKGEKTYSDAILLIQPARIEENLRAKIGDDQRLKQALTFTKVGVKINPDSGTSETEALRFEELGRIDSVFETPFDLNFEKLEFTDKENQIKTIRSLLFLSSLLVERIGGKRRRGAGKCEMSIENLIEKSEALTHLESYKDKESPIPPKSKENKDLNDVELNTGSNNWRTYEYTLTLETPVSIVTAVLGNVSETLDFIPGTYLISYFVKHLGKSVFDKLQANDFQILPATISIDGQRGMPIPKVFAQEKMDKSKIYNRLSEIPPKDKQTKPIREGFIKDINATCLSVATTPLSILMHNAVDDDFQRPTTDVVGVYSREAIRAGTILKGEIRFRGFDIDVTNLNGKVRIGTSKKDDYGLAKIEFTAKNDNKATLKKIEKELIVYLASDVMLRNDNLRQTNLASWLGKEIGEKLGVTLTEIKTDKDLITSIIPVRRIESWQVGWGFPRPSLCLMQAGSVVRFSIDKEIDVAQLEAEGIGERRGEGYGQIIFNPKILEINKPSWEKGEIDTAELPKAVGEISNKEFAKLIEKTAWQEELKIAVSKIAVEENLRKEIFGIEIDEKGDSKKSIPPMSQIGGLRSVVERLQKFDRKPDEKNEFNDKEIVVKWLEHLKKTKNRIEKWDKNKNVKQAENLLDEKLFPFFKNIESVWKILFTKKIGELNVWKSPKLLVRKEEDLQKELWAEAVKSLFYACQHAHKRELEKGGKN